MSAAGEGLTEPHYDLRTFLCADAIKSGQYLKKSKSKDLLSFFNEINPLQDL